MRKILIVHNFFGPRRVSFEPYEKDPLFLAKMQIQYLEEVKHNLDHVVFTVNRRGPEDEENILKLSSIFPEKFQGATTEILIRENVGLSYGAFSDVYAKYRRSYDYYFFTEDDYLFCEDWFDSILIDMLLENENPGYLCGAVREEPVVHAGNSVGVATSNSLERIFLDNSTIPHVNEKSEDNPYELDVLCSQILHSSSFHEKGFSLTDIRSRYTLFHVWPSGYEHWPSGYEHFHQENSKEIITPVQRIL